MKLRKMFRLVTLIIPLAVMSSTTAAHAQNDPISDPTLVPNSAGPLAFKAGQSHYVKYPTLVPSTAIVLTIGPSGTSLFDTFNGLVRTSGWKCTSPKFYKAAVLDKSGGKEIHQLKISVELDGNSPSGAPYIDCDGKGHPNNIYIVLQTQPKVGDFVQLTVFGVDGKTEVLKSDGTLSMTATDIPTLSVVPQAAPGEALNNGATRTVGQLSIAFADMNLAPRSPVNVYAKTTDLLSTDGKDSKSALALTGGLQRGVFPGWYSPISLEQTLQGNQTAKNLSTVTSLNFNTLPPWRWSSGGLNNHVISAPLPPEPTIANLYTHRFEQLVTKKTPQLAVNDYSLNGSFAWDTISFPFTCRLLFWEKSTKTPTPAINGSGLDSTNPKIPPVAAPATLAAPASTNCLGAEIDLGGWYLPLDLTTRGTQKFEGYGDVSILIPLSDFSVASSELLAVTKTDPTKFQVRIKWTDAVNAANGYARTRGWTFGLEAIK
jgi:hypothetical protein